MAGPSLDWLNALNSQLGAAPPPPAAPPPDPFAAGAASAGIAPPRPAGLPLVDGSNSASVAGPPIVVPGVPPAPATPAAAPEAAPGAPMGPPPAPNAGAPEGADPGPSDVQFLPVGGGATPAREVPTRGPTQQAYLDASFEGPMVAADRVDQRSAEQAQRAVDMYDRQADEALSRQQAFERQAARRAQELQRLRADYDETVQRLGEFKVDNNRLWASASTPDKIGAGILMFLGGAFGGDNNKIEQIIDGKIREDVELQQQAYKRGLDVLNGQKTAYALAMEQYNSEDAAYNAALSAGQQATAAKVAGMEAQWRGTEAANAADMLRGNLVAKSMQSRAEGYKYLQPGFGSAKYKMFIRGQEVPGLVDEKRAQEYTIAHGVQPAEKADQAMLEGGIQSTIAQQKIRAEQAAKGQENVVVLPNGEQITAPNPKEAETLRGLSTAVANAQQLVREAKEIRSGTAWRVPGTAERARLEAIQSELTLSFKDRGGLGALSGPDMDLALGATGNITSQMPTANAKLDSFERATTSALRNRVKTIPGAPPKTAGKMPSSFQPAGKK